MIRLWTNRYAKGRPFVSWLFLVAFYASSISAQESTWVKVFNGTDLTGLKKHGNGTVTTTGGLIEVNKGDGYLYTEKEYTHYRARVEWMNIGKGNTGFLYHINEPKQTCTWPAGLELQMARGDVGSIWTTDCKFNSTETTVNQFDSAGRAVTGMGIFGCQGRKHFLRSVNKEITEQWNMWEIFVKGDSLEIKVNGSVVMRTSKLRTTGDVPMVKGSMGLQIEGSQVQWKNWEVMDLTIPVTISQHLSSKNLMARSATLRPDQAAGVYFSRDGLLSGTRFDIAGKTLRIKLLP